MGRKITIADIAKYAEVSRATVSRVLNGYRHVSEEKRQRVEEAMQELQYTPSYMARHLRTQKSRLIGFLTDEVATTPYAGDIIKGAEEAAWELDYMMVVMSAGNHLDRASAAVNAMREREVEGIIYAAMYHRPVELPENIFKVPTVLANCFDPQNRIPAVVPDEELGGYQATVALLQAGHQRIGFININQNPGGIPASRWRQVGYHKALSEYDITYDEDLVRYGFGIPEHGYRYAHELLELPEPPTALFCGNDRTAMGAYNAIRERGLRIPQDVAVIGFDNQEIISASLRPGLTTMQLPHYQMGEWAMNYLIQKSNIALDGLGYYEPEKITCGMVERESIK